MEQPTSYTCRGCGNIIIESDIPPYLLKRNYYMCKSCHSIKQKQYRQTHLKKIDKLPTQTRKHTDRSASHFICIYCNKLLPREKFTSYAISNSNYICIDCEPLYKKESRDNILQDYLDSL